MFNMGMSVFKFKHRLYVFFLECMQNSQLSKKPGAKVVCSPPRIFSAFNSIHPTKQQHVKARLMHIGTFFPSFECSLYHQEPLDG
jgi:hypothetical protein